MPQFLLLKLWELSPPLSPGLFLWGFTSSPDPGDTDRLIFGMGLGRRLHHGAGSGPEVVKGPGAARQTRPPAWTPRGSFHCPVSSQQDMEMPEICGALH